MLRESKQTKKKKKIKKTQTNKNHGSFARSLSRATQTLETTPQIKVKLGHDLGVGNVCCLPWE